MIQALEKIPTSGQYEEIIFDIPGPWHGKIWNFVLFTTSDDKEWCGHFRGENLSNFLVAELPNEKIACIISGGHGYIIDIDQKVKIKDILSHPITGVIADIFSSSFIIATFFSITQINNKLEEIDIVLPSPSDGIELKEIKNRKLEIEVDFIFSSESINKEYYIDLNDMKVKKYI